MPELSTRGQRLVDAPPMPGYISEHFTRLNAGASGYVGLCIAENKLQSAALNEQLAGYAVPASALGYDAMTGNAVFRERLARYMGRTFLGRDFLTEQIVLLAGAGSVLEMLFYVLCDSGDGVLVPTPSYAGFWPDLETRDELNIVPVHCASATDFRLTPELLDHALEHAAYPVTAMLFTTPNNPLGRVYSRAEILEVAEWAARRDIHLVVDEIYALSVFGSREFVSVASVLPELGDKVHVVWGFSKDFGASGLRAGVMVSENRHVLDAAGALAYWAACSGHTQHLLSSLITDDAAVDAHIDATRRGLAQAYGRVTEVLDAFGIPYIAAEAAFFLVCDLRRWLQAPTFAAEQALWRRMLDEANVNLTPGEACRISEPGFFRLCYAGEDTGLVTDAIKRLGMALARA